MGVPVGKALITEEFAEVSGISSHAWDHHTHVRVNFEHLLLVRGEVMDALLESDENLYSQNKFLMNSWLIQVKVNGATYHMVFGLKSNGAGSLLHGLFRVVDLE